MTPKFFAREDSRLNSPRPIASKEAAMENTPASESPNVKSGLSTKKIILIILGAVLLTAGLAVGGTVWWIKHNFDPSPMKPVVLSEKEQLAFDSKLTAFVDPPNSALPPAIPSVPAEAPVPPKPAEPGAENRTLIITEREVNAYLAKQNLGEHVTVYFGEGQLAAGIIVSAPPDFPLLAGQKVRVRLTLGTGFSPQQKLSFVMEDLSVGGISLPNAWLGDLKGVDLIAKNLEKDPAIQRFLAGIQELDIHPGSLRVVLNK